MGEIPPGYLTVVPEGRDDNAVPHGAILAIRFQDRGCDFLYTLFRRLRPKRIRYMSNQPPDIHEALFSFLDCGSE